MLEVNIRLRRGDFKLDAAFSLQKPGVIALFGPSGCGKSSLIQCVAGLTRPDEGRIELNGEVFFDSARGIDVAAARRGIGCVFQDSRLFPHFTVRGNLLYGAARTQRAGSINFDDIVSLLDLHSLLERRPGRLSGGERQRVAIGRALLAQPRLLLLDEPLASLDHARRDEVLPYLEILRDRLAIPMLYVSHQFEEVLRLATDLVLMRDGSILAQGDLSALSLSPALQSVIGADLIGSVVNARLIGVDPDSGLARLAVGQGELKVAAAGLATQAALRIQLLACDIIVATAQPANLSVRNCLAGTVCGIAGDKDGTDLIRIDIGGETLIARITAAATHDLELRAGRPVWALIKSVSIQGHSFAAPAPPHRFTAT